ncbi:MAG: hypothetical protein SFV54_23435 [Bryobacteraceae bacterium]|nr:hypothetical protein [Bryobacteraceae bacterium]
MQFTLIGFQQANSVRRFAFESVAEDRSRHTVVVSADLAVARRYQIQIQDLPLLCRRLLIGCDAQTLLLGRATLTEAHMASVHRATLDAAEDKKNRRGGKVTREAWQRITPLGAR